MRTLDEIITNGIKDDDWTYCKAEYAPHAGCKVGMPEECTPDGTKKNEVKTCYLVAGKFGGGVVQTNPGYMYLDDGNFYWYDNLWYEEDVVEQEKTCGHFVEPIAWIEYQNTETGADFPVPPYIKDAVPTPVIKEDEE